MKHFSLLLKSGFILPVAFVLWVCWICADDWNHDPNYSYGWLILPFSFFFLYRRLKQIGLDQYQPQKFPVYFLYPIPLIVLAFELVRLTPLFWRTIPWGIFFTGTLIALAFTYKHLGRAGLRALIFPLTFFALSIPWPSFLEVNIIREFSFWVAQIVGELLLLGGIFCNVQGKIIQLADGSVGVDEACSGLRSLQASLMIGFAVGEWYSLLKIHRILLIFLSILTAFLSNLVRAYALSLLIVNGGEPLFNEWHDTVGTIAMVGLTLGIVLLSAFFPKPSTTASNELSFSSLWRGLLAKISFWKSGFIITVLSLLSFASAHAWYAIHQRLPSPESPFLSDHAWGAEVLRQDTPPSITEILRADSGEYKLVRSPYAGEMIAYHFFWKPARSNGKVFYHRPDVCMPGGGWTQEGTASLIRGTLNHRETVIHHFRFSRANYTTNLFWICWADDRSIEFKATSSTYIQSSFIPEFIRLGKRVFAVEIFGIATTTTPTTSEEWNLLFQSLGDFTFELEH